MISTTSIQDAVPTRVEADSTSPRRFSHRELLIAEALASAAIPEGAKLEGGNARTAKRLERFANRSGAGFVAAVKSGLWTVELSTVIRHGRRFSSLPLAQRISSLRKWNESRSRHLRWLLKAILVPVKFAHFDDDEFFRNVGCSAGTQAPKTAEPARWKQQMLDGKQLEEDTDLECEVVVIGTGAGGAAAAYELARRGRAVLLLEAGDYHDRTRFDGRSHHSFNHMYLAKGATVALGNIGAPVWAGAAVGGSTIINSGTCYRAPEWVLEDWAEKFGLTMLSAPALAPYYERVEAMLQVEEAPRAHLGGPARVVARGATALKLSHKPLRRNAPGCDGQGVCCFGCPTGAKRSTDVSYVPAALDRGAQLVTAANVERVDVVAGRARGVTARLGSGRILRVHAEVVVVAGGSLLTPGLLGRSQVATRSGWLGKNLSVHPASRVMAMFDEEIDMSRGIPQSYTIDEFRRQGLMFEGASTPLDVTAAAIPYVGEKFTRTIERYPNLAQFGFMIRDTSRGEIRSGPKGFPIIRYDLNRRDTARMQHAIEILSEVFLRAGATRVMPMVHGFGEIKADRDLEAFRRRRLEPGDFEVTAYHPLGTCRMGTDPEKSCVGPDGEAHDTANLHVADGSVIPSSLGVNPQMTIMAMALRTAEAIDSRL